MSSNDRRSNWVGAHLTVCFMKRIARELNFCAASGLPHGGSSNNYRGNIDIASSLARMVRLR